ncbi:uncharacterized protein MONBRDRAFT_13180 [Monosiga brevicollis MX1]|uniref:Uncharacterized protein n=1 Tax=Monosiga brevicollis TaxID=81824 RepID=A9VEI2_MONBE|nr:uncharacterized protein MONBRDRAFT_13180 [Monosiga brevicollis MX1]EDQ84059.1 predicted protein [Monosiga brevicollis MX1]|eukprot:XP_001751129.1 hypothetical protein [Monosiga brevicollis MX1]
MHELFWTAYEQLSDQGLAAAAVTRLFDDNEGQYRHRPMRQVQPQTVSSHKTRHNEAGHGRGARALLVVRCRRCGATGKCCRGASDVMDERVAKRHCRVTVMDGPFLLISCWAAICCQDNSSI